MRKLRPWLLGLFGGMLLSTQVMGGTWTANEFFYKPDVGARGGGEKARYDSGLDRIDARLGKTVWVGDPNYGTTLQSAITAIGANNVILRVPTGTYDIATNLTIPANVSLRPERGAVLSIATGVTLTINGALDAGPYQIFSCTGTGKVVFNVGTAKEIYPEWWLTNIPPGTIDMSAALQAAFNAAKACKIPVLLSNTYLINTGISLTSGWTNLRIINRGIIKAGAAIQMIDLDGVGWYGQLELQLDGNHIATGGLRIGASQTSASSSGWSYKPWDITIYNVNGDGFAANWCENVAFTNIDINYCNGSGLKPRNCQQWVFTKAWLGDNAVDADFYRAHSFSGFFSALQNTAAATWSAGHTYSVNNLCRPTVANGYRYKCLTGGTSDITEPTWPTTLGNTITDNGVVWVCIAQTDYHLKIVDSHLSDLSGWFEGNEVPASGQCLIDGNCIGTRLHDFAMNSVNTNKDFFQIGSTNASDIEALTSSGSATKVKWTGHPFYTGGLVQLQGITQADWTALNNTWYVTRVDADNFTVNLNSSGFGTPYDPITDNGTYAAVPQGVIIENLKSACNTSGGKAHVNIIRGRYTKVLRNRAPVTANGQIGDIDLAEGVNSYGTVFEPFNPDYRQTALSANAALTAKHQTVRIVVGSADVTATLPDVTKCAGKDYWIFRQSGTFVATIATYNSQIIRFKTVDINTSMRLPSAGDFIHLKSNGTLWCVLEYQLTVTANITPGDVQPGAHSSSVQAIAGFAGCLANDQVNLIKAPIPTLGVTPIANRCTTASTVELIFVNITAGVLTPAAGDYTIRINR